MKNYEVLYIIANGTEESTKEALILKFKEAVEANQGQVEKIDKWGIRKFAYPINKKNEGYYVLMTFSCKEDFILELERQMRISDEIVRHMVIAK